MLQLVFGLAPGAPLAPGTAAAAFRSLDRDKDGALSPTELAVAMAEGRAPPRSEVVEQAADILATVLGAPTASSGAPPPSAGDGVRVPRAAFLRFLAAPSESSEAPAQHAESDADTDDAADSEQWHPARALGPVQAAPGRRAHLRHSCKTV